MLKLLLIIPWHVDGLDVIVETEVFAEFEDSNVVSHSLGVVAGMLCEFAQDDFLLAGFVSFDIVGTSDSRHGIGRVIASKRLFN